MKNENQTEHQKKKEAKKTDEKLILYLSEDKNNTSFISSIVGGFEIVEMTYRIDMADIHTFGHVNILQKDLCANREEFVQRVQDESFQKFTICFSKKSYGISGKDGKTILKKDSKGYFFIIMKVISDVEENLFGFYLIGFNPSVDNYFKKIRFRELDEQSYQIIDALWRVS